MPSAVKRGCRRYAMEQARNDSQNNPLKQHHHHQQQQHHLSRHAFIRCLFSLALIGALRLNVQLILEETQRLLRVHDRNGIHSSSQLGLDMNLWHLKSAFLSVNVYERNDMKDNRSQRASTQNNSITFGRQQHSLRGVPYALANTRTNSTEIDRTLFMHGKVCRGKEPLLHEIQAAGLNLTKSLCRKLPRWDQVEQLYGKGPIILGLETCARYRQLISAEANHGTALPPLPKVAGLWNCGTTTLTQLFLHNFQGYQKYNYDKDDMKKDHDHNKKQSQPSLYDVTVTWGKHTPVIWKYNNTWPQTKNESRDHILPVVVVRDPYRWMNSMCRKHYDARWQNGLPNRCPNFIPTEKERRLLKLGGPHQNVSHYQVVTSIHQTYYKLNRTYESLAEVWSTFNREYWQADFPRLMVRTEDLIFYPKQVMQIISECSGMPLQSNHRVNASSDSSSSSNPFDYIIPPSKPDSSTDWISAMAKYGSTVGRISDHITPEEHEYLQSALDAQLMKALHYPHS